MEMEGQSMSSLSLSLGQRLKTYEIYKWKLFFSKYVGNEEYFISQFNPLKLAKLGFINSETNTLSCSFCENHLLFEYDRDPLNQTEHIKVKEKLNNIHNEECIFRQNDDLTEIINRPNNNNLNIKHIDLDRGDFKRKEFILHWEIRFANNYRSFAHVTNFPKIKADFLLNTIGEVNLDILWMVSNQFRYPNSFDIKSILSLFGWKYINLQDKSKNLKTLIECDFCMRKCCVEIYPHNSTLHPTIEKEEIEELKPRARIPRNRDCASVEGEKVEIEIEYFNPIESHYPYCKWGFGHKSGWRTSLEMLIEKYKRVRSTFNISTLIQRDYHQPEKYIKEQKLVQEKIHSLLRKNLVPGTSSISKDELLQINRSKIQMRGRVSHMKIKNFVENKIKEAEGKNSRMGKELEKIWEIVDSKCRGELEHEGVMELPVKRNVMEIHVGRGEEMGEEGVGVEGQGENHITHIPPNPNADTDTDTVILPEK